PLPHIHLRSFPTRRSSDLLHPSRHVAAIKAHNQTRMQIEKTLMQYLPPLVNAYQPLFKIRPYDNFPDVMIYTNQYAIGFPNGRKDRKSTRLNSSHVSISYA